MTVLNKPDQVRPQETRFPMPDATLRLLNGELAIVDADMVSFLSQRKWRVSCAADGSPAAVVCGNGDDLVLMHRVLTLATPGTVVDHKNGNPLDNTRRNLRVCTHADNMKNRRLNANNRSGFKGCYLDKRAKVPRWRAEIRSDGKRYCLGSFPSPDLAHQAYRQAAVRLHGEFANFG
jgi:hypothetical protein